VIDPLKHFLMLEDLAAYCVRMHEELFPGDVDRSFFALLQPVLLYAYAADLRQRMAHHLEKNTLTEEEKRRIRRAFQMDVNS
jgi:hypothetical protein